MTQRNKKLSVADFLARQLEASGKSQKDVAQEAGFDNPNIITMLKQGHTKVPLTRVGALSAVLGVDPAHLMRMVLEEYMPDTWLAVEHALGRMILTRDEERLIRVFREMRIDEPAEHLAEA